MKNNDLNQIRIFAAVADAGSFTQAARQLGMEKSSVSTKVSQLEQRLGVRLLQRTTRSVKLTEAGQGYLSFCHQALEQVQLGDHFIQSLSEEPSGRLRLSAPMNYVEILMQPVIQPFLDAYPKVSMEFLQSNERVNLVTDAYDLALRVGLGQLDDSSLVARKLYDTHLVLVASTEYLENRGIPETMEDLDGHEFVGMMSDSGRRFETRPMLWQGQKVAANFRFLVNGMFGVKHAIMAGLGIGIVPLMFVLPEIRQGQLKVMDHKLDLPKTNMYAVYPSRVGLPAKTQLFLEHLLRWGSRSQNAERN